MSVNDEEDVLVGVQAEFGGKGEYRALVNWEREKGQGPLNALLRNFFRWDVASKRVTEYLWRNTVAC